VLFYLLPEKFRWLLLLSASFCFYAFVKAWYLLFALLAVIGITYTAAIQLEKNKGTQQGRIFFWAGILANILILSGFKYTSCFANALNMIIHTTGLGSVIQERPVLTFIGTSFYVFQAISYLIDVYLDTAKCERHLGYFALYISFFPKLLMGPIERAQDLLPQFRTKYQFSYEDIRCGLLLCAWGLFKKLVIADRLGIYVNPIYGDVRSQTGAALIVATYCYAIQIYADFSGYTDIALGSARIFNIHLNENFRSPYLATSIADFWRRWHISLYRWLVDYIFKPFQFAFRDYKQWGTVAAVLITFLISGIWHGGESNFIAWGLLFGIYLSVSIIAKPVKKKISSELGLEKAGIPKALKVFVTFHLVCFGWIFFRANGIKNALYVTTQLPSGIKQIFVDIPGSLGDASRINEIFSGLHISGVEEVLAYTACGVIIFLEQAIREKSGYCYDWLLDRPFYLRWLVYIALVLSVINLGKSSESVFVYFSF
jgi:alginate O-acetyltransferase complex protein AlgI